MLSWEVAKQASDKDVYSQSFTEQKECLVRMLNSETSQD